MSIDFQRGAKVTGSKFYFSTGKDAEKEWSLIDKMIKFHLFNGYQFVIPPYLVNRKTAEQAGIVPRFEDEFYQTKDGFILIPTAETALVGMHSDEIIPVEDLPIKYVAFSPCFRRESGSYGKRDKGLRRVHQFHKVELFTICRPQDAAGHHETMIAEVRDLMAFLGVTHRVRKLDEKERSPVATETVDIELKHGDEWLEVSSISRTGENQSKPALVRYREDGKIHKAELINGSGVALPRLMLALNGE